MKQVMDGHVEGTEPRLDFFKHPEAFAVLVETATQKAQVKRDGNEIVSHLVGHVGGHLAQVGQPILAGKLAILRFQLVSQPADFRLECLVSLFQTQRGPVPGGQNRLKISVFIGQQRLAVELGTGWVHVVHVSGLGFTGPDKIGTGSRFSASDPGKFASREGTCPAVVRHS